jgi:uncharacterized repeat protein (TIGR01451 family)
MGNKMTNTKRFRHWFRRIVQGGIALSVVLLGLVAFTTVASAHDDLIVGVASCASPLGSGYTVSWTISNNYDMSEAGTVTSVTGGLATLHATTFSIGAQSDAWASHQVSQGAAVPFLTAALSQKLPAKASGVITLNTNSTWADGTNVSDAGTAGLSGLHCGAPVGPPHAAVPVPPSVQSIAGHIYLCTGTQPSTTEVPGGTLASTGPETLGSTPNPLVSTQVAPGVYVMTATPPPDYLLVACGGSSTPSAGGNSAAEGVSVPAGGSGVGIFYVTNAAPAPVSVPLAAIAILKAVCGTEVAAACGPGGSGPWTSSVDIPQGDTAYWKVTVTNTGETPLANVTIADPLVPGCDSTGVTLAVGASMSTYCALPHIGATVVNVATASFGGLMAPFPTSSAQAMDSPSPKTSASPSPKTSASAGPVVITTSGALDTLVPVTEAPLVTG